MLQEVFAAAFNAMLADERAINVRPWLYRIARNRSLNHLRRTQAIGVDSMDIHLSEGGLTTADKVHKREEFRLLVSDVRELPETQRTALLLREIDALSYEQISEAMETTVPSVKSLLVRARVSLAEAAEARLLTCDEVRDELGEVAEGLRRTTAPVRRHLRTCDRCTSFRKQLRANNKALAAVFPVGPLLLLKKTLLAHLGTTAAASGGSRGRGRRQRSRRDRRRRRAAGRRERTGHEGGRRPGRRGDRRSGCRRGQARRRRPVRTPGHGGRRDRAARGRRHALPAGRRALGPAAGRPAAGGHARPAHGSPQGRRQADPHPHGDHRQPDARRRRHAAARAARGRHHDADRDRGLDGADLRRARRPARPPRRRSSPRRRPWSRRRRPSRARSRRRPPRSLPPRRRRPRRRRAPRRCQRPRSPSCRRASGCGRRPARRCRGAAG